MKRKIFLGLILGLSLITSAQNLGGSYSLKNVVPYFNLQLDLEVDFYSLSLIYNSGPDDLLLNSKLSCGKYMTINNKIVLYDIFRNDCYILTMIDSNILQVDKLFYAKPGTIFRGYPYFPKYISPEDSLIIGSFNSIQKYSNTVIQSKGLPSKTKIGYYNAPALETHALRLYKNHTFKLFFGLSVSPMTIFEGQWWDQGDTVVLYDQEYKRNYFLRHTQTPDQLYPINLPTLYGHELLKYIGTNGEIEGNWFQRAIGHISIWVKHQWHNIFG